MRMAAALFETLTVIDPATLEPAAGAATFPPEISEDGLTYTFHLQPEGRWSNGDAVTAHDFVFAWRRVLEPVTAADYVQLLFVIDNAEAYYRGQIDARTIPDEQASLSAAGSPPTYRGIVRSEPIPFEQVGIRAVDEHTLEVRLRGPVPYFLDLTSMITFAPLHRATLERFEQRLPDGTVRYDPRWYRTENLVGNGAFRLAEWLPRQVMRFERSETYWNRANVPSRYVEVVAVEDRNTAFMLYESGDVDLMPFMPPPRIARTLYEYTRTGRRDDVFVESMFGTYFFKINVLRSPTDDRRVRRALSMAIDREAIVSQVRGYGERATSVLVPEGTGEYVSPEGVSFDPAGARALLASAGYDDPGSMDAVELLFNHDPTGNHLHIAEAVKQMWQEHLGITVQLRSIDRPSLRMRLKELNYSICRAGWYGDYWDPMTFLELFVTAHGEGGNNDTGFANQEYDGLIRQAMFEADAVRRNALLARAERMLVVEHAVVIPLFTYVEMYLYDPDRLEGMWVNRRGVLPLQYLERTP